MLFEKTVNNDHEIESPLIVPQIVMKRRVLCEIMCTVGARTPETGGILLGPIGSNDITDFYFDAGADCTSVTYTTDHVTLRRKMQDEWLPSGLDFKGFVHSHPGASDRLSDGDLRYIRRLLEKNTDMEFFAAPIVIPHQFRLQAIVVLREQPDIQHATSLRLF